MPQMQLWHLLFLSSHLSSAIRAFLSPTNAILQLFSGPHLAYALSNRSSWHPTLLHDLFNFFLLKTVDGAHCLSLHINCRPGTLDAYSVHKGTFAHSFQYKPDRIRIVPFDMGARQCQSRQRRSSWLALRPRHIRLSISPGRTKNTFLGHCIARI